MAKMTVTEGLAEIKTNKSLIGKKREAIGRFFSRHNQLRDPLEKEGGSVAFIQKTRQSITDLQTRSIAIRCAIQRLNLESPLQVNGRTASVQSWLNWRKEHANDTKAFMANLANNITSIRNTARKQGMNVAASAEAAAVEDIVVNLNEAQLSQEIEDIEKTLGELDGKLSLFNATATIDV